MEFGLFKKEWLNQMVTNNGDSVFNLTFENPVLLVFLRHFGCNFCKEALVDISKSRSKIETSGLKIVFVHMTDFDTAEKNFSKFGLLNIHHVSDPNCRYYSAFGLVKGNFNQLFGLQSLIRGFSAGIKSGQSPSAQIGDGFQMPGVFVIDRGELKESFIHNLSSDRPDYLQLASCCVIK
ncbi:MAG: SelL-related redox protein [Saprospiraceae bacterium]|nr:SelL-related redox protein [Saprospiraceae bacterium]